MQSEVSRSGVIPGPTVIVRMGESNDVQAGYGPISLLFGPFAAAPKSALILVTHNNYEVLFTMNQTLLSEFGSPSQRVENALESLRNGRGVLVLDDEDRENEGDMIFAAQNMTVEQMALTIRYGSGIVCLCLTEERRQQLALPMMVERNSSHYQTAFTVTIEAAEGVSTGVSAADRLTTIRAAIKDNAKPTDLNRPGHVFPLCAQPGGVLVRGGHTEAAVDLTTLAGLKPAGVLCEVTNDDGSMAHAPEIIAFGRRHNMPVLTIEDLVAYRRALMREVS
ncbi:3,4-dihydroxy-2-butanone 4-phosphate synthase [Sodalis glossinidius str. 'morsitans']|nr:3,4-dihydroxy-2-butanone 4-phosphate synthase [Sodalis glossinidius str. 'morsitans']